jgi:hypothetical protein
MIDDADEDGSGSINFPEFVGLMMKKQEGTISKEEIKQVFKYTIFVIDEVSHSIVMTIKKVVIMEASTSLNDK